MAKQQPQLQDLVEILIQCTSTLTASVKNNSKEQIELKKSIDSINLKPDLSELKINQNDFYKTITLNSQNPVKEMSGEFKQFQNFLNQYKSTTINYLVLSNFLFFFVASFAIYVAVDMKFQNQSLIELEQKNIDLVRQCNIISKFFDENPKNFKKYQTWSKKQLDKRK